MVHQQGRVVDGAGFKHGSTGVSQFYRDGAAAAVREGSLQLCDGGVAIAGGECDAGVTGANAAVCGHGAAVDFEYGASARSCTRHDGGLAGQRGVACVERVGNDGTALGGHADGSE